MNDKSSITNLFKHNGEELTDRQLISDEFCSYFTNIGRGSANTIPKAKYDYRSYLRTHNNRDTIYLVPTDAGEVRGIMLKLKPKKSSGYDKISNYIVVLQPPFCQCKQELPLVFMSVTYRVGLALRGGR